MSTSRKAATTASHEPEQLIKSRDRVRDLAEVYTAKREVNAMLDLVKHECRKAESRFLEPACGTGNFLVEVLARKLAAVAAKYAPKGRPAKEAQPEFEYYTLVAVSSVYGIDICPENVETSRQRLLSVVHDHYHAGKRNTWKESSDFFTAVAAVLRKNIVQGDSLNKTDDILLSEWSTPAYLAFKEKVFRFSDLTSPAPTPVRERPLVGIKGLAHA
jgi:hypothetical protein